MSSSLFPVLSSPYRLPAFRTILFKGSYSVSSPLHLAVTHAQSTGRKTILLTPSRATFLDMTINNHDSWIEDHGGDGSVARVTQNIIVIYAPSPAHLQFSLAMLRTSAISDTKDFAWKMNLDSPPSLIVIHEPARYFANDENSGISLFAYIKNITEAIELLATFPKPASLAVFDSRLDGLELPVVAGNDPTTSKAVKVEPLVEQYFEWVGSFERVGLPADPDNMKDDSPPTLDRACKMILREAKSTINDLEWSWRELRDVESGRMTWGW